jgi:hypothetical protein
VRPVSRGIDRIAVTFDDPNLLADAGLLLVATLVRRLGLEGLCNTTIGLSGRTGGFQPGRKILTLIHTKVAGATHQSRRHVAGRIDGQGVAPPGHGTLDAWDIPAWIHLWSRPSVRKGDWGHARTRVESRGGPGSQSAGGRHRLDHP